jgi:acetoin utilization deacetylase AcuC-like enzyme
MFFILIQFSRCQLDILNKENSIGVKCAKNCSANTFLHTINRHGPRRLIKPVLHIILHAGTDVLEGDPLGNLAVTEQVMIMLSLFN